MSIMTEPAPIGTFTGRFGFTEDKIGLPQSRLQEDADKPISKIASPNFFRMFGNMFTRTA